MAITNVMQGTDEPNTDRIFSSRSSLEDVTLIDLVLRASPLVLEHKRILNCISK